MPALPADLVATMELTQTWMGEAIKFAVEYILFGENGDMPGLYSVTWVFAREVHDLCNVEESLYAHFCLIVKEKLPITA